MQFDVITIFPQLITDYCTESLLGRAQQKKTLIIHAIDLRDFTHDPHRTVDDAPYGGGPGMVLKPEPLFEAVEKVKGLPAGKTNAGEASGSKVRKTKRATKEKIILLSPRGKQFDQAMAKKFAKLDRLILVCGRYEGVDQRAIDHVIDEEISVGPYILQGGELGALVIIETVSRYIPGVLGNKQSIKEETFSLTEGDVEYPQYTRPQIFKKYRVPPVLLSGDHKKIADWRRTRLHPSLRRKRRA